MTNRNNNPHRPIVEYQELFDDTFGSDMTQARENRHATRILEAIDYAEQGNYTKAASVFLIAFTTAPTEGGQRYCQTLSRGASDANSVYENALSNSTSEVKAKEEARIAWDSLQKESSVYLNFLGVYFSERKKYSESIQYYDRAIKLNPSYAMAYFGRASTKIDLYLFDEAILDLQNAAQLFYEQTDLPNYQNVQKIMKELQEANSASNRRDSQNLQEYMSKKDFGSYEQMLHNAAILKAFSIQAVKRNPKASQEQQKALASSVFFEHLKEEYGKHEQEKIYTDLDREFMKATCFQHGLDLQEHHFKDRSSKSFFIGFLIGGLIVFIILSVVLR